MGAEITRIEEGNNLPVQMNPGHVTFQAKIVKGFVLIRWLLAHYRHRSLSVIIDNIYRMQQCPRGVSNRTGRTRSFNPALPRPPAA